LTRFSTRSLVRGLTAAALALFAFSPSALSEPASESPPNGVLEAVAAAQTPESPAKVAVGAYINDIQELDFKTNSYAVDLYVWFRWKPSDLDPSKTMEFMNRYDPNDHERDELYDKPKQMPDGSLYAIVRNQGRFSTKFQLGDYPFDTQFLTVVMEDTISSEDTQVYVPDPTGSIGLDPEITLPGFKVGKPEMRIVSNTYPTNFGDLAEPQGDTYSRVVLSVPVTRPLMAMSVNLRSHRVDRDLRGIGVLRAPALRRGPHRAWHHRPLDAGRAATHLERFASRRRLSDDARQDLSARLRVHHRGIGTCGADFMARSR
jgi:hypothetical protein